MGNVLKEAKRELVLLLGRRGAKLRHIEEVTGVRRETASRYLKAAGIAVRPPGGWGKLPAKAANEVITDLGGATAKAANGVITDLIAEQVAKAANEAITDLELRRARQKIDDVERKLRKKIVEQSASPKPTERS